MYIFDIPLFLILYVFLLFNHSGLIYFRHDGSDLETVSDLGSDMAVMSDNDDFDADFKYGDQMFMDEETKSRFTNYSMSSSVIRRNEGLTLLDDRFEKVNFVISQSFHAPLFI
jgi:hypothetical protein